MLERGGVIYAVIACCGLIVAGETLAVVALWRGWLGAIASKQTSDNEHYLQLVATNTKDAELKHDIVETLKSHTEVLAKLSEKVAVMSDRAVRP